MSFSDCRRHPLWVFSTCPFNLQPCWNHSALTLVLGKKRVHRALSRDSWRVSSQTLVGEMQPSVHTSSPALTRRKCSKFNLESYGFECWTAWVSEFLSFDFTQHETRGLNLPGRAAEHPGVRLNLLCCELAVVHTVRAGECLVKCHCCNLTVHFKCCFLLSAKNGNEPVLTASSLGKSVILSLLLISSCNATSFGGFWQEQRLRGTGNKHGYRSL